MLKRMTNFQKVLAYLTAVGAGIVVPLVSSAHEVYVLTPTEIQKGVSSFSPNPLLAISGHESLFIFWGVVSFLVVVTIFCFSLFRRVEKMLYPWFMRMKHFAPLIVRVTLGVCLITSAYYNSLFGPELPLSTLASPVALCMRIALFISGLFIALGYLTRLAALLALCIFGMGILFFGVYMVTYSNFVGEMLLVAIVGGGMVSLDGQRLPRQVWLKKIITYFESRSFLLLRIGFGMSVMAAAVYAKFLHSNLALETIQKYSLTSYFHFDPLFIVLGAFIIEMLIGVFILFGVELRWTAIFFLFWLSLSVVVFGESVWPHLVLVGLNLALIFHGYDRYTIIGRFFTHPDREPVL